VTVCSHVLALHFLVECLVFVFAFFEVFVLFLSQITILSLYYGMPSLECDLQSQGIFLCLRILLW
jgi:hypothetical protein